MSNDETQDVIIDDPEWDTILRESELSPYKRDDIHTFTIDLFFVFNILNNLKEEMSESYNYDRNYKNFKELIKLWNKKYKTVLFQISETSYNLKLKVFVNTSLDASKALITKMSEFIQFNSMSEDSVEAVFQGDNTISINNQGNHIEVIYLEEDMLNYFSPEFRFVTYFGLLGGFENLNLQSISFGYASKASIPKCYKKLQ